jgi:hypothetical protein
MPGLAKPAGSKIFANVEDALKDNLEVTKQHWENATQLEAECGKRGAHAAQIFKKFVCDSATLALQTPEAKAVIKRLGDLPSLIFYIEHMEGPNYLAELAAAPHLNMTQKLNSLEEYAYDYWNRLCLTLRQVKEPAERDEELAPLREALSHTLRYANNWNWYSIEPSRPRPLLVRMLRNRMGRRPTEVAGLQSTSDSWPGLG